MEAADKYLNVFPSERLAAVSRGEINLNELACEVLAGRGLDESGAWLGFRPLLDFLLGTS